MSTWIHRVAWLLVAMLIGVLSAPYITSYLGFDLQKASMPTTTGVESTGESSPQLITSFAESVALAEPAVVEVYTSRNSRRSIFFNDGNELYQQQPQNGNSGIGSGVIINDKGYIVTSYHVIENANSILVGLHSGETLDANIVGSDPETDLAVLKIDSDTSLQAIAIADSDDLRNGDIVLSIGNPFGVGKTATMGIVSATGRSDLGISAFESFIQTDAAINPGSSGGALINVKGELVGINSAIFTRTGSYQGVGFAAPSKQVVKVSNNLIDKGKVVRGWLGISIHTVFRKQNKESATEVIGIFPDGPAEAVGILPGDILLSINQETIGDASSAQDIISGKTPGEIIEIQIIRDAETLAFEATIGQRPRVNK